MLTVTRTPANLRKAIKYLEQKNAITVHRNPNKRYSFDRTRHFLLHPNIINEWLTTYTGDTKKTTNITKMPKKRSRKQGSDQGQNTEMQESGNTAPHATTDTKKPVINISQISEKAAEKQQKPSDTLIKEALLQELPEQEKGKADNILKTLQDKNLYQAIIEEWQQALNQGKVKNKFSYLAGLVNRANQGKFHPTASKAEQHAQQIVEVISVPAAKPQAQKPHDIFPTYKDWQATQQAMSKQVKKSEYMNFVLPVRAYESDKAVFLRCPNVYCFDFMKNNQQQVAEIVGGELRIYMG